MRLGLGMHFTQHFKASGRRQLPGRGGLAPPSTLLVFSPTGKGLAKEPAQLCHTWLCDLRQAPSPSGTQFLHLFEAMVYPL